MTVKTTAWIVRNEDDVARAGTPGPQTVFLCTRPETDAHCRGLGLRSLMLDEDRIREEYVDLNVWCFAESIRFVEKFDRDTEEYEFFYSHQLYLQRLFIQAIKDIRVIDAVISDLNIGAVRMRDHGESVLGAVYDEYFARFRPDILFERVVEPPPAETKPRLTLKSIVSAALVPIVNAVNSYRLSRASARGDKLVLASGALNHLAPVLTRLQEKHGHRVVWVENAFNAEKFKYAEKQGMIHLILPKPRRPYNPFESRPCVFSAGEVVYRGVDYSELFAAFFNRIFATRLVQDAYDRPTLKRLYAIHRFDAILLDEDLAMRRMFGALDREKEYYVVSHGIPGGMLNETGDPLKGRYRSGITFVNGPFEKYEYEKIFYSPDRVVITGTPRYDRIHALRSAVRPRGCKKTVLYCGAGMRSIGFEDLLSMVGLRNFFREYTTRYLNDLLSILDKNADVILKTKPHYHEEDQWRAAIPGRVPSKLDHQLLTHQDDVFALEAEADLIVTTESSVVIEAILFDKPVILLNYSGVRPFSDYHKWPIAGVATNTDELSGLIRRCLYDADYLKELSDLRKTHFDQYVGYCDGGNADRVAAYIAEARTLGAKERSIRRTVTA